MNDRSTLPDSDVTDKRKTGTLEQRISDCYEFLPNSERRVADLLLNFPAQLATHSATELASLAGASKAAVSRLIQRLGYASYASARARTSSPASTGGCISMPMT